MAHTKPLFTALLSTFIPALIPALVPITSIAATLAAKPLALNDGNLLLTHIPPIPPKLVHDLNRYQNIRSADFKGWSADGNSIYLTTRFGDVEQIHRVDQPGGARQQLTFFNRPVDEIAVQPHGNTLALTMDTAGNEARQLFLFDLTSGETQMISDGQSRNQALLWSRDGKQLAYQSNRRNGRANDIWLTWPDKSGQHRQQLLVTAPDGYWWEPSDFSPDGKTLLLEQYISATHSQIWLKDLVGGTMQPLPGQAKSPSANSRTSRNIPLSFNASGDGVFLLTDRYSDFTQLSYLDRRSRQETVISANIHWDVTKVAFAKDHQRAAFVTNEGGLSKLFLLDPQRFTYRQVDTLPVGIISGLAFSPDGSRLALTLGDAKTPKDIFVLALTPNPLVAGVLKRWTTSEVGGLNRADFIEPELIHYPGFDRVAAKQRQIPAFVYRPQTGTASEGGKKSQGPHPVVLFIHGGPELQYRPHFSATVQLWVKQLGVAVIAPNIRGSSGYGKDYVSLDNGFNRHNAVKDIGALLDWIERQSDLDSHAVAVFGFSYGGYMALASAVEYSQRLTAAVDVSGISNFVTFLTNTKSYRRDRRRKEYGDERNDKMRRYLNAISPVNQVDKIRIPVLIVQGQNDPRVPVGEATQMVRALRANGNTVWYMNALNEGHGYAKKNNRDVYRQVTLMFLKQFLGKPKPAR